MSRFNDSNCGLFSVMMIMIVATSLAIADFVSKIRFFSIQNTSFVRYQILYVRESSRAYLALQEAS